jgi:hypothetical protein
MPPSRDSVGGIRTCVGKIEVQVTELVKSLDKHQAQMKEDVDLLHRRIDKKTEELRGAIDKSAESRDEKLEGIDTRLDAIDHRHSRVDGAKTLKAAIFGALILFFSSISGAVVALFVNAWKGIEP